MSVKPSDSLTIDFCTQNASTGAATDADSTPTGTLVVNGVDNGASVAVTNKETGCYKAAVTIPADLSAGDEVQLRIAATVNSIAGKGIIWQDQVDTKIVSDLNDIAAGALMGLADDAITSAKFDESTAFPLKSADTGSTQVARVGADSDTLETLSDQLDTVTTDTGELQTDWVDGGRLDLLIDAILADTGTDGVALSTTVKQAIADEILKRGVSNVEDTADAHSLTTIILAALESAISGTVWTVKKTDGTTFTTKTLTTDVTAAPITGVT